jgi:hypothetical protein
MRTLCFIVLLSVQFSCERGKQKSKVDSILFITEFNPSFTEPSKITIIQNDSTKKANIVIFFNPRFYAGSEDSNEYLDTFYSKSVILSDKEIKQLESDILIKLHQGITRDSSSGLDGILINYQLKYNENVTYYSYWSPDSIRNKEAQKVTLSFLNNTRDIFNDSIISDHCDDLEFYLNEKNQNIQNINRPINVLRRNTYANKGL